MFTPSNSCIKRFSCSCNYILSYKMRGGNVVKFYFYLLFFRIFVEISIFNKSLV